VACYTLDDSEIIISATFRFENFSVHLSALVYKIRESEGKKPQWLLPVLDGIFELVN
jgi:hypothetical protein